VNEDEKRHKGKTSTVCPRELVTENDLLEWRGGLERERGEERERWMRMTMIWRRRLTQRHHL
jgi:hypothetical protein